jgi:hypothetical protein
MSIVLLGFRYSLWSDYRFARQFSFDICILGFSMGLEWPLGQPDILSVKVADGQS